MRVAAIAVALCLALTGCVTTLVPDDYAGPTAVVKDSFVAESEKKADFFFLTNADGKSTYNALIRTAEYNDGRGLTMEPQSFERRVPIKTLSLTIEGRTRHAAPILALFGDTEYRVVREVTLKPSPGRTYVVKGVLTKDRSDVWIEDGSGRKVSKLVK